MVGRRAGALAPADRGGRRARRRRPCPTRPAAPPTPRRCSSSRACSRAGRRARRSCWPRSTAATLGEVGARAARRRARLAGPRRRRARDVRASARTPREPSASAWSNDTRRVGIGLERTAAESLRQELDAARRRRRRGRPARRLAFPLGIGAQGVLLERGLDAVRISGSGELPPPGDGPVEEVDEDRLGALGRGDAADGHRARPGRARPSTGPSSYVIAVSQVLPGLGGLAARRRAAAARARGLGRRLRPRPPPPRAGAARGCAGSAPGWRRFLAGLAARRAARAGRRHAGAAARARSPRRAAARRPRRGRARRRARRQVLAWLARALARRAAGRPARRPGRARRRGRGRAGR